MKRTMRAAVPVMLVVGLSLAPEVYAQDGVAPKKKTKTTSRATTESPAATPQGNLVDAGASAALNPDVLGLRTSSDLIIKDLGFNGSGEITFQLTNRGEVPINPVPDGVYTTAAAGAKPPAVPESQQIQVTVYLGTAPFRTVFQPRLGGKKSKTFILAVPEGSRPRCAESRFLRTVIDPGKVIPEYTDTNNVDTLTAVRPCPDLAVKSITKNTNKWKTEFVARVTIINQGNAPVDKFDYLAKESFGGSIFDLGALNDDVGGPLAPGETMKFNIGSARAHQNLHVEVLLDRHRRLEELDESNNYRKKTVN